MNYGVIRHQERFVSQPGDLIVRGFPPYECPGCGSRLRLDTPSLAFEKVYELCCEGGIVDIEALPWTEPSEPASES